MGIGSHRAAETNERRLTLVELADGKHTDKAWAHSYLPVYDRLFRRFRDRAEPMLEIGGWYGGSWLMWAEYFTRAPIVGVDVKPVPLPPTAHSRIQMVTGDAYSQFTRMFLAAKGPYSIIVDDGPHTLESQLTFCRYYPMMLASDGFAIVEDVQDPAHITKLRRVVPEGFRTGSIDLRKVKGRYDDILFFVWRKRA